MKNNRLMDISKMNRVKLRQVSKINKNNREREREAHKNVTVLFKAKVTIEKMASSSTN